MYITLLQIVQMLVGMWITVRAVLYQVEGLECHVNKTNSVLGLTMYFSYFVLFGKLFIDHYYFGKRAPSAVKREKSVVRSVSSKVIQSVVSDDVSEQMLEEVDTDSSDDSKKDK